MPSLSFFNLMENALAASDLKQQVFANNIANQNTPGFKEQNVVALVACINKLLHWIYAVLKCNEPFVDLV